MLKTALFLLLIGVVWGSMLIPLLPLLLVSLSFDIAQQNNRKNGWLSSIMFATDITTNTFLGGYKRTTISAELGNLKLNGSRSGTKAADFVDWLWLIIFNEKDHCISAMETEDLYLFTPGKALIGASVYITTYYFLAASLIRAIVQ
jgi:hypothetical protein